MKVESDVVDDLFLQGIHGKIIQDVTGLGHIIKCPDFDPQTDFCLCAAVLPFQPETHCLCAVILCSRVIKVFRIEQQGGFFPFDAFAGEGGKIFGKIFVAAVFNVSGNGFFGIAQEDQLSPFQKGTAGTELTDCVHIVAHIDHGSVSGTRYRRQPGLRP